MDSAIQGGAVKIWLLTVGVAAALLAAGAWAASGDEFEPLQIAHEMVAGEHDAQEGVLSQPLESVSRRLDHVADWVVILVIVAVTFAGVGTAAALTRTKPAGSSSASRAPSSTTSAATTSAVSAAPPAVSRRSGHAPGGERTRPAARPTAGAPAGVEAAPQSDATPPEERQPRRATQAKDAVDRSLHTGAALAGAALRNIGAGAGRFLRAVVLPASMRAGAGLRSGSVVVGAQTRRAARRVQGAQRRAPATDWRTVARHVHDETGGDPVRLQRLAEQLAANHARTADLARAAGRPARIAAWALSAIPPGVVLVGVVFDFAYAARLAANLLSLHVLGAVALTLLGAWWLHQLARPPFSLRPAVRRDHAHERAVSTELEHALERGSLFAASELPLEDALERAIDHDLHPAWQVREWVARRSSDVLTIHPETALGRCTRQLDLRLGNGVAPEQALAASARAIRLEQAWPTSRGLVAALRSMVLPLLACILPATLLLLGA